MNENESVEEEMGLYIHIPFCVKKCAYCDFLSFGGCKKNEITDYINALCKEIEGVKADLGVEKISTLYIGGGTPSILSVQNFNQLMACVKENFEIEEGGEFTIEVNPGTLTDDLIKAYLSYGVNRVSMGLQSSDDQMLKELGRIHSYSDFEITYKKLLDAGIDNLSIDVMFALSGQTMVDWLKTLDTVVKLKPKHISAYSLIIEEETEYEERYEAGLLDLPDEDLEREMFWVTHERLEEAGYHHYEISNYGKPGYEARHNSSYWKLVPYIGLGLGASSYYKEARYKNISDRNLYIEANGDLELIREKEQDNDQKTDLEEAFFLGLRQLDGVDVMDLMTTYGLELVGPYYSVIVELIEEGLLESQGEILIPIESAVKPFGKVIKLTKRGVDISNQVMSRFLL